MRSVVPQRGSSWLRRWLFGSAYMVNNLRFQPRLEAMEERLAPAAGFAEFIDPNPAAGNQFGHSIVALSTGNVVITSPFDDAGGTDAGAVYLFNGATGALISTLIGSQANDQVGIGGVTALSNGNYVVGSHLWDNGAAADAGAVTWGDGVTGISGTVSDANSLAGGTANNLVGYRGITALSNGNYVVNSYDWDNGAATDAGAVTWGDGATGISGTVSAANSLVGSSFNDYVGRNGITELSNGNYVVSSISWRNGAAISAGAVTWGDGTIGISGTVSAANSLVGGTTGDQVGRGQVGHSGITALSNGNYVVCSFGWHNGVVDNAGAVTWGDGTIGISGFISEANSLVGSTANDFVGWEGTTALSNGNYVVNSYRWNNGAASSAGAVTWGDGAIGVSGTVSAANSLVGDKANDSVGIGNITVLSNGNYVVRSPNWGNGAASYAGAATWGDANTGINGIVSAANSLVGGTANDHVGNSGITALSNGNYVVSSDLWNNDAAIRAGAATWGDGNTGISGIVSAANSLVGGTANNQVGRGGTTALSNGNYVVNSFFWDNGSAVDAGAVTWGGGATGTTGTVSAGNSLVGSTANDRVGFGGITALSNGNYVVSSNLWDNGPAADAGAVTWGDGATGISGIVGAGNSLVGGTANDQVGLGGITVLGNSNYVVGSYLWDNGAEIDAGAATWGDGTTGIIGIVSAANSLVGSTSNDQVGLGGIVALNYGNYVVNSAAWDDGAATDAGAVTWGDGATGTSGAVSTGNSLFGGTANTSLQNTITDNVNATYFGRFLAEGSGRVRVGSQFDGLAIGTTTTTVSLTAGANPSMFGDSLTFTAIVTGATTPTGTVEFYSGLTLLGAATAGPTTVTTAAFTFTIATLPAMTYSIQAVFTGSGIFQDSDGLVSHTITTRPIIAASRDSGSKSLVRIFDAAGELRAQFQPFGKKFKGGVRVAVGDFNNDGILDVAAAQGAGGSKVRVYVGDLAGQFTLAFQFRPFGKGYNGGLFVAAGDVLANDELGSEIIVARQSSNSSVRVYSGLGNGLLSTFVAFPDSKGGALVAVGNADGAGLDEIIVMQRSVNPVVRITDADGNDVLPSWIAVAAAKSFVAVGDLDGDTVAEVALGTAGQITTYQADGTLLGSFAAYTAGQVRLAIADLDGDGNDEILTSPGKLQLGEIRVFEADGSQLDNFLAFDAAYMQGVFLSG